MSHLASKPARGLPTVLAALALLLPQGLAAPSSSADEPTLAEIRAATERFRDVSVALAEGYVPDPGGICHTAEMEGYPASEGAMGIHYFRLDLLGITATSPRLAGTGTHTDWLRPAILLYEPRADGTVEMVGVENLVFRDAWLAAGHEGPPTFHGRTRPTGSGPTSISTCGSSATTPRIRRTPSTRR